MNMQAPKGVALANESNFQNSYWRILFWCVALLFPAIIWLSSIGNPIDYWQLTPPPGQRWYIFSKLMGLYGIVFLWLHIALMAEKKSGKHLWISDDWSQKAHRLLGTGLVVISLIHIVAYIAAISARNGQVSYQLLVPTFDAGFFKGSVSLGIIGAVLLLMTFLAGMFKWRTLHLLAYPVLVLVLLHSVLIGSETRDIGVMALYSLITCWFITHIFNRLIKSFLRPKVLKILNQER